MAGTVRRNKIGVEEEAKRACFFKDGDTNFSGINVSITKNKYRSFDSLLDDLSFKVPLPFGVRSIQTPSGAHFVHNLKEIKHGKNYVCSTFHRKPIHKIDYVGIASRRPWDISKPKTRDKRLAASRKLAVDDFDLPYRGKEIKPKAITIVAQEDSRNRAKIVLSKKTALTYNSALQTISNILQLNSGAVKDLYTVEGKKIAGLSDLLNGPDVFVAVGRSGGHVNTKDVPKALLSQRKRLQSESTSRPSPPSPPKSPRKRHFRPNYSVYLHPMEKKSGGKKKPKSRKKEDTWIVTVQTADEESAGTDGQVTIQVYGADGKSEEHVLCNSSTRQFERGTCDEFELKLPPIGEIFKIRLQVDGVTNQTGWLLKEVLMTNINTNQEISFSCDEWIKPSDFSTTAVKELPAMKSEKELPPVLDYEVSVYTGDVLAAGTDSRIYVILFGEQGDTGRRYLNPDDKNEFPFERGNMDTFHFEAVSLGAITHLLVGHDNSGESPGWFLDKVIVGETGLRATYTFPCRKWLDKDEDDGEIERILFASVLSDSIVTKEELWETYGWKVNNASQVSLVSVVTEKHLRIVRKKDEVKADADKDQAAVFTVSEGDDMEVRIFSALKQGVIHLTLDQDKIFTSTGKSGLLSEFYVHWVKNGNMVLESVVHSGQYIVVKPNGTLSTGSHEDGIARELRIHAKGTLRDKGRIRIRVRRNGDTVVVKNDQLYSDGDRLDEEGEFCVVKVDEKMRAFKSAVTDKFISINSEEIACQGLDHDDVACKFIIHRNKVEGYVQLESLKMPGVYLGVGEHGKVKHAVDAGDEITKLCLEVISYGYSKARGTPPELTSSESESEEEFVNNENSDEEFRDEDGELQVLESSLARSEEETAAFAHSYSEEQKSSRQDGDKISSIILSSRPSPASSAAGKVHTPTPPKTPRDSSVPRRTPRVRTPVVSRSPSVASVLSAASSVSLPESPGSGKNSLSSRHSRDDNSSTAEDDQKREEELAAINTRYNNSLTVQEKDTEPLESVISEGYSNEEKEMDNQDTELDIDNLKYRKTSNVSRNSNESKIEEDYYDNDVFEKDEEKDGDYIGNERTAEADEQTEKFSQQVDHQSDQGPTRQVMPIVSPVASEGLEAPSPEDSLGREEAYDYQDSLDENTSTHKVDSRSEKEYLDLNSAQYKDASCNEEKDEIQSFTNELDRENNKDKISVVENAKALETCQDITKADSEEPNNRTMSSLSFNGSENVDDIAKSIEVDNDMDKEDIVLSEDEDTRMIPDPGDEAVKENQSFVEKGKVSPENSEDDSGISMVKSNGEESDQQPNDFNEDEKMKDTNNNSQQSTLTNDCKVTCTEDCKENDEHRMSFPNSDIKNKDIEENNSYDNSKEISIDKEQEQCLIRSPDNCYNAKQSELKQITSKNIDNDPKLSLPHKDHNQYELNTSNSDSYEKPYNDSENIQQQSTNSKTQEHSTEQKQYNLEEKQSDSTEKETENSSEDQNDGQIQDDQECVDSATKQHDLEADQPESTEKETEDSSEKQNDTQTHYDQEHSDSVTEHHELEDVQPKSAEKEKEDSSEEQNNDQTHHDQGSPESAAEAHDLKEDQLESAKNETKESSKEQGNDQAKHDQERTDSTAKALDLDKDQPEAAEETEDFSDKQGDDQTQHDQEPANSAAKQHNLEDIQPDSTPNEAEDFSEEQNDVQPSDEQERADNSKKHDLEEDQPESAERGTEESSEEQGNEQAQHDQQRTDSAVKQPDLEEDQPDSAEKEAEDSSKEQNNDQTPDDQERADSVSKAHDIEEDQPESAEKEAEDSSEELNDDQTHHDKERTDSAVKQHDLEEDNKESAEKEVKDSSEAQNNDQAQHDKERADSAAKHHDVEDDQLESAEKETEDSSEEHNDDKTHHDKIRTDSAAKQHDLEEDNKESAGKEVEDSSEAQNNDQIPDDQESANRAAEAHDLEKDQQESAEKETKDSSEEHANDQTQHDQERTDNSAKKHDLEEDQPESAEKEMEDSSEEQSNDQSHHDQERANSAAEAHHLDKDQPDSAEKETKDYSEEQDNDQTQHDQEQTDSSAKKHDVVGDQPESAEKGTEDSSDQPNDDQIHHDQERTDSAVKQPDLEQDKKESTEKEAEDSSKERNNDQTPDDQERADSAAKAHDVEEDQPESAEKETEDSSEEQCNEQTQHDKERADSAAEQLNLEDIQPDSTKKEAEESSEEPNDDQTHNDKERTDSAVKQHDLEEDQPDSAEKEAEDSSEAQSNDQTPDDQERTDRAGKTSDWEEDQLESAAKETKDSSEEQGNDQTQHGQERAGSAAKEHNIVMNRPDSAEKETEDSSQEQNDSQTQHDHGMEIRDDQNKHQDELTDHDKRDVGEDVKKNSTSDNVNISFIEKDHNPDGHDLTGNDSGENHNDFKENQRKPKIDDLKTDKDEVSSFEENNNTMEEIKNAYSSDISKSRVEEENKSDEENTMFKDEDLLTARNKVLADVNNNDHSLINQSTQNDIKEREEPMENDSAEEKECIDIEDAGEKNLCKSELKEEDEKEGVSTDSKNSDHKDDIVQWTVETSTGSEQQKQYRGNIFVTFYGKIRKSQDILLKNEESSLFMPREVNSFKVSVPQIGIIYKVRLSLQDEQQDEWWLKKIRLSGQGEEDMVCEWDVKKTLSLTHNDHDHAIELPIISSKREPLPVLRYQVTFITGVQGKDYNDSKIYICLVGEIGDSGIRRLKESVSKEPKFMSNQTDTFMIDAVYLGKITKVLIGHDGTATDWALSKILVKEYEDAPSAFVFNCTRPLETKDGSLETELIFSEIEGDHPKLLEAGKLYIK